MPSKTQTKNPQYKRLANQLRNHIRTGNLKPGDRLPSYSQMQRDFGVNISTIERAQKELAAEGLLISRQGSGTFVAPKSIPVRKGIIGLCGAGITHDIEVSPYWARLIQGIRQAAESAGHHILLLDNRTTEGWEKADGMLVADYSPNFPASQILPGLPCVSLLSAKEGICSVYSDDAGGISQSVEYLAGLGHRKIGYIGYFHHVEGKPAGQRVEAYRAALTATGIRVEEKRIRTMHSLARFEHSYNYGEQLVEMGRENMREWLNDDWAKLGCTALLAHNDDFAFGVIEALQEVGIRVPDDVSVIGFDGIDITKRLQPSLSTVEVPVREIGVTGVELLLRQIEADKVFSDHRVLPTQLRARESSIAPSHD